MEHLSNELLLSIFSEIYHDSRVQENGDYIWDNAAYDLSSSSLFPYSVAAVCHRWRGVMESQSAYWTRIISVLDCPKSLTRAGRQLALSKDHEVDFYLLRPPPTYTYTDPTEGRRCRPFIDFVVRNFDKFRSITFSLIHGSSLPSIACDFHGQAPRLLSLTLEARIRDASNAKHEGLMHRPSLSCPALSKINVDTLNFVYAHHSNKSWATSLGSKWSAGTTSLITITLSPSLLAFQGHFTYMNLFAILAQIPRLDNLTLDGVQFDHLFPEKGTYSLLISSLTLKNLGADLVRYILKSVEFPMLESAVVSGCHLGGSFRACGASLVLHEINAYPQAFHTFLELWSGPQLRVVDCVGFTDEVIEMLGQGKATSATLEVRNRLGSRRVVELGEAMYRQAR